MALDNPSYFSMANPPPINSLSSSISSTSSCSSPHSQSKRSLRSLLRSLSTNSTDSNHELLNTGAPRLSDIAPEFKYPVEPRRANSLKSRHHHSRTYAPLPTQEIDTIDASIDTDEQVDIRDDDDHEDEVFLTHEDDSTVRYYNVKASSTSSSPPKARVTPRRHSISTLRTSSTSRRSDDRSTLDLQAVVHASIDGHPNSNSSSLASRINLIDDHKLRHGSYPRKRCNRCPRGVTKRADMEDILIVSAKDSEPANLWAQYFSSYFEQISQNTNRKPYRIRHLGIEEIISNNGDVRLIAERTTSVKLQIVILCPLFLEKIQDNSQLVTTGLSQLLHPDRILALQLGTSDEDITDLHKEALPSFLQWQRRPVGQDQDQNFAHEFVATAIGIFTKIWKQQSSIATEENSQFSIAPKKIRHGQTSVLILLEYPLLNEDIIKINIVKNEELTEIKNVKRRNPYTLKFTVPEKFLEISAIANILVEKNGSFIGKRPIKCESRLRELEQILRSTNNPIEFMCQSLGFSPYDTEQLDNWLVHMFQKNVPPNFQLFVNKDSVTGSKHVCELFPTLLHFSARFGLEKLTAQLLDCPGGDLACEIRNVQDFTPADIAENVGHKEINNMLRGYMKMNELATVYTRIKKLTVDSENCSIPKNVQISNINATKEVIPECNKSQNNQEESPEEEDYLIPKKQDLLQMDEFYKLCPAPKPVNFSNLSKSAPCTPVTEDSSECPLTSYIAMNQQKQNQNLDQVTDNLSLEPHESQNIPQDHNYQNFCLHEAELPSKTSSLPSSTVISFQTSSELSLILSKDDQNQKKHKTKLHSSLQNVHTKASKLSINEDKVQVELAEIINDFKNNVHTIAQTEQLVAEWQNRNDVQKSFKEKQDQLKEMRQRYEQIQKDMKHNGRKSSSPFERFKKIFSWNHPSSTCQNKEHYCRQKSCIKEQQDTCKVVSNDTRPISSLSLQSTASSASSGMSTISGCSLGDSGTHSDHEERKIILTPTDEDLKSPTALSNFNNYLIPPTPRPIKTPLILSQSFPTIEERIRTVEPTQMDPYYIQFPPNGLPIPSVLATKLSTSENKDEVDFGSPSSQLFTIQEHNIRLNDDKKTDNFEGFRKNQEYMNFPSCSAAEQLCQQHDYMNFKTASS